MERLVDFASSAPEFRRVSKGNIRHRLSDIIVLTILARASKCLGRAEIIAFGKHNLGRFRSMGMLRNGVPDEEAGSDGAERRRRIRDAVEAALSDVNLLGTEEQVRLASKAAGDMVEGRSTQTVSSTHRTLPAIIRGQISVGSVR